MSRIAPPLNVENFLDVLELEKTPTNYIPFFKNLLKSADKKMADEFLKNSEVTNLVRTRGWCVEQIIMQLWYIIVNTDKLALVAVGGFGRGDLHPFSDVDLLIIKPRNSKTYDQQISLYIQALWDIGLDIGSSVRTPKECFEQAKEDVSVATNLMEARFILGNRKSFTQMQRFVTTKKIWKGEDFFTAKWEEQKIRHRKFSDTTYNVEPNIKEGPGGLRDIQMVSWVVQRFFQTNSLHELVDTGFLTEFEYIQLKKGQNFLWKVRFALHIIAGRKEDRVLFDYQLKLAKVFGFHDEGIKNPAVEQFMQVFYSNAMQLERLNSLLLQLFDEKILKQNQTDVIKELNNRFHTINNFLEIKDTSQFQTKPTVWFELFLLLQKHPKIKGIRADTVRAMRHNINQINDEFRNNPLIKSQFIKIFQQKHNVDSVLKQLNLLGILARYLPVFGKIVGRMQFDLFHIFTVDQHSLFTVRNLCLLRLNKTDVKRAAQIFNNIPEPYLVYIAALYHDIAKGREGHHADLGAVDANEFCENHKINEKNTKLIVWLVKNHLIMSETAQKRDLSDPETIKAFAKQADSLLKLRSLYLLTIADISATDPKLWNGFKETLLHELFLKTKQELTSKTLIQVKQVEQIEQERINQIQQIIEKFELPIVANISPSNTSNPSPDTKIEKNNNTVEFLIYCKDFKGLFYIMSSILEKYNFSIVDANIDNTEEGYALNTVHCIAENHMSSQHKMIEELKTALKKGQFYEIPMERFTPESEKLFKIKPKVLLLKSTNRSKSMIEVICRDRHGLLAMIAKTLLSLDISINAAKIVIIGARAENTYWLDINQKALTQSQLNHLKTKLLEQL